MEIGKILLEQVARGLRSKNLVYSNDFVNGGKRFIQQIFRNKKTNGLVLKQYALEKDVAEVAALGYSGKTRVLGFGEKEWKPLFEYAQKDALEPAHVPYCIVNTVAPEKAVSRTYINDGNQIFKLKDTAKLDGDKLICSNPHLSYSNMNEYIENNVNIALPI